MCAVLRCLYVETSRAVRDRMERGRTVRWFLREYLLGKYSLEARSWPGWNREYLCGGMADGTESGRAFPTRLQNKSTFGCSRPRPPRVVAPKVPSPVVNPPNIGVPTALE